MVDNESILAQKAGLRRAGLAASSIYSSSTQNLKKTRVACILLVESLDTLEDCAILIIWNIRLHRLSCLTYYAILSSVREDAKGIVFSVVSRGPIVTGIGTL